VEDDATAAITARLNRTFGVAAVYERAVQDETLDDVAMHEGTTNCNRHVEPKDRLNVDRTHELSETGPFEVVQLEGDVVFACRDVGVERYGDPKCGQRLRARHEREPCRADFDPIDRVRDGYYDVVAVLRAVANGDGIFGRLARRHKPVGATAGVKDLKNGISIVV